MNHHFKLRSKEPSKESAILYKCYLNGTRFTCGVGLKIYPELWDEATQRPTTSKPLIKEFKTEIPNIEARITNLKTRLDNICNGVEAFVSNCQLQNTEINLNALKCHLDEMVLKSKRTIDPRKKEVKSKMDSGQDLNIIHNYLEKFIWEITNGIKTIRTGSQSRKRYTPQTIRNYVSFSNQWLNFEKFQKRRFTWDEIDLIFYETYLNYLNSKKYKWDTVGKAIKHLKVIAQAAVDDGIHNKFKFRDPQFKALKSDIDNIALTFIEVELLENLDLSKNPAWDKARDIFLMGCYTALRFSDLKRLMPTHFKENYIAIITKKTKKEVIIPMKPEMKKLAEKYQFRAPKISEQKVNEYIKSIAKMAGIVEQIEKKETIGGEDKIKISLKYERITTHTARRTAATHMYLQKMLPIDIMAITSHKNESSFLRYICLPKEERVKRMAENEFFK
ncbi:MAG: tyrosine-type recombinase/integrase [Saprospiraceae bacterium]|nr:tyrosine-type recombinase/integrase [Candidatus Vicinibacter affinis]